MKALISFLTFLICSLCCYSQSSVTGAQQKVAAQRESFSDIINVGDLIKSVKEDNVGIKKVARKREENSGKERLCVSRSLSRP